MLVLVNWRKSFENDELVHVALFFVTVIFHVRTINSNRNRTVMLQIIIKAAINYLSSSLSATFYLHEIFFNVEIMSWQETMKESKKKFIEILRSQIRWNQKQTWESLLRKNSFLASRARALRGELWKAKYKLYCKVAFGIFHDCNFCCRGAQTSESHEGTKAQHTILLFTMKKSPRKRVFDESINGNSGIFFLFIASIARCSFFFSRDKFSIVIDSATLLPHKVKHMLISCQWLD